jgi:hypothetical protein
MDHIAFFTHPAEILLQNHTLRPEQKSRKPRVDWQARGREFVEYIREIVRLAPKSLTRGKLLAELGIGNMLRKNPEELKRTREEIQKACLYISGRDFRRGGCVQRRGKQLLV